MNYFVIIAIAWLAPDGHISAYNTGSAVDVRHCLHLKSGCSYVGQNSILVNRELADVTPLAGFEPSHYGVAISAHWYLK